MHKRFLSEWSIIEIPVLVYPSTFYFRKTWNLTRSIFARCLRYFEILAGWWRSTDLSCEILTSLFCSCCRRPQNSERGVVHSGAIHDEPQSIVVVSADDEIAESHSDDSSANRRNSEHLRRVLSTHCAVSSYHHTLARCNDEACCPSNFQPRTVNLHDAVFYTSQVSSP